MSGPDYQAAWTRALKKIDTSGSCWLWNGSLTRGYGLMWVEGKYLYVHRVALLATGVEIPAGMQVDHLCHVSAECRFGSSCQHSRCVNPSHLQVVTPGDNVRRIWESGLCRRGHPLTERGDGTGWRVCVTCLNAGQRRRRLARAEAARA